MRENREIRAPLLPVPERLCSAQPPIQSAQDFGKGEPARPTRVDRRDPALDFLVPSPLRGCFAAQLRVLQKSASQLELLVRGQAQGFFRDFRDTAAHAGQSIINFPAVELVPTGGSPDARFA